jgi:co-chaperonin GroES (HSP10)
MKAISSRILVVEEKQQDTKLTEKLNGFEVPIGAGEFETYRVISVGEEVNSVKEGDIVLTYLNPGHKFSYSGVDYKVISITDILVVL